MTTFPHFLNPKRRERGKESRGCDGRGRGVGAPSLLPAGCGWAPSGMAAPTPLLPGVARGAERSGLGGRGLARGGEGEPSEAPRTFRTLGNSLSSLELAGPPVSPG